jgi:hypothetical protein
MDCKLPPEVFFQVKDKLSKDLTHVSYEMYMSAFSTFTVIDRNIDECSLRFVGLASHVIY